MAPTPPNDPLESARSIIEDTSVNLFLTGKAGTGKTTFLHSLSSTTSKRHVILAPTGVAAINGGGSTIHSFFQLSFAPYLPGKGYLGNDRDKIQRYSGNKLKIIRTLDLIIIDEISMVRPDVLDAMDAVLRRLRNPIKPFGGVQLLLIGDLRQLAPVAQEEEWNYLKEYYNSPYFFESHALKQSGFLMVELTKVYRQTDKDFIDILNSIRDNRATCETLRRLNLRANPGLMDDSHEETYIRLTTHNYLADRINAERLSALTTPSVTFHADISGDFPESAYPADPVLQLKKGAKVMFIKNDISGNHEYYNGLIGTVVSLSDNEIIVRPEGSDRNITVGRAIWERVKYSLDKKGEIVETPEGEFSQIPLRLAWSITIHKSQGLTFDRAIVDASNSFAPGQTYVALSRCRSLEGLILERPLPASAIMTDPAVNAFISSHPKLKGSGEELDNFKESYYAELLAELFDFRLTEEIFDSYYRATVTVLGRDFPNFVERVSNAIRKFRISVTDVSAKLFRFFRDTVPNRKDKDTATLLKKKISGGATYFASCMDELLALTAETPLNVDNQALKKRVRTAQDTLRENIAIKHALLSFFITNEFDPRSYLKHKTKIMLEAPGASIKRSTGTATTGKSKPSGMAGATGSANDIENPELYHLLTEWRNDKAREAEVPAYRILQNKSLMAISASLPRTRRQLESIPGMGKVKINMFGSEILDLIHDYSSTL